MHKNLAACAAATAVAVISLTLATGVSVAQAQPAAPAVIVAAASLGEISDRLEALGTAMATEAVTITSVIAERVVEVGFEDGDKVTRGQMLVKLDNRMVAASLERARVTLAERENALTRAANLASKNLASAENLDAARLAARQAEAEVNGLEASVDRHIIRAPFDGTVGLRRVSVGALVSPGNVITTLDDTSEIKLDFSLPSVHLPKLSVGQTVKAALDASGIDSVNGVVATIGSRVDPVTRSVLVRAIVQNDAALIRPGMLMRVTLLSNPRQALMVPENALVPRGSVQSVYVVGADNTAELRTVKIGTRSPGRVEVISGLTDGERVITEGVDKVRDGQPVTVRAIDDGTRSLAEMLSQAAQP